MDQVQLFGIGKRVKTKIQKYIGANCYVCRNYRRKLVGGAFLVPSILNRVNVFQFQNSNCGFLTDFELCQSGWSILETLNIVKRKIHFSYYRDCSNILVISLDFINKF